MDHENRPVESNNAIQPRRMLLLYLTAKHTIQTKPDGYRSIRSDITTGITGTVTMERNAFQHCLALKIPYDK